MCINKKQILNRKYTMTKKNGGIVPVLRDRRQMYVMVPCGQCYVCKRKKAREWRMRLSEDLKVNKNAKVVLLTFSTESLRQITNGEDLRGKKIGKPIELTGYELDNEICRRAVKAFRERWRKKYGRSIRHWLITELGTDPKKTEHVHMHGLVWIDDRYIVEGDFMDEVERIWAYGMLGRGRKNWETGKWDNYINEKTASYFTKYVSKRDDLHKEYNQIILTSAGIGKAFLNSVEVDNNRFRGKETNQLYQVKDGGALPMPEYFRRKLYTDEQREKLTGWMLDEGIIYIDGKPFKADVGDDKINLMYKALREKNARLGFGDGTKNWARKAQENSRRRWKQKKRGIYGAGYRSGETRKLNPNERDVRKRS